MLNHFYIINKTLESGQIESILRKFDKHKNKHVERIYHPIGGKAFLFYSSDSKLAKDYKCDGYNWRALSGAKKVPD